MAFIHFMVFIEIIALTAIMAFIHKAAGEAERL